MGRSISCVVVAAFLAAGCTATSGRVDSSAARIDSSRTEESAAAPLLVVDAENIPPGSSVKCREGLKPGSNVIVTRCMTENAWARYRKEEAEQARALLRVLQGGAYSNW